MSVHTQTTAIVHTTTGEQETTPLSVEGKKETNSAKTNKWKRDRTRHRFGWSKFQKRCAFNYTNARCPIKWNGGTKLAKLGANLIIGEKEKRIEEQEKRRGWKGEAELQIVRVPEREGERNGKRGKRKEERGNPSIYMIAVCLGRLLMGRKRIVVIKGTRDSI